MVIVSMSSCCESDPNYTELRTRLKTRKWTRIESENSNTNLHFKQEIYVIRIALNNPTSTGKKRRVFIDGDAVTVTQEHTYLQCKLTSF